MEEKFVPHVIEPSFGLGRILFAVLEHSFRMRDEKRTYFHLRPRIAPLKCSILPLLNNPELNRFTYEVRELLKKALISCKVDDSGQSIGRRYARTDEIGIPFAITVDFDSLKDGTVALRELSQCGQIRVPRESLSPVLRRLLEGQPWAAIEAEFPKFSVDEKDEK
jgi:glycyl-tRNA synthetase